MVNVLFSSELGVIFQSYEFKINKRITNKLTPIIFTPQNWAFHLHFYFSTVSPKLLDRFSNTNDHQKKILGHTKT